MVRTKTVAAKGKGKATAFASGQAEEIVREMEEEEEMIANPEKGRAKRRTAAEDPFVRRIHEQGLSYYLALNPGYNKGLVIEFYKNEKIPSEEDEGKDDAKITSKIGKVSIEVTPGFIAHVLNYHQPPANDVNYPDDEYVVDEIISRPTATSAPRGAYLTTLPLKGARSASWNKLLFCQEVAIMGCMKKIKKETRDNARRQWRIDHKLDWVVNRGAGQASEPDEGSDDFAGGEPEFVDDE
ncbi:hypothetical protein RHSIM_Rhsim10G0126400 [Rhododendron simsii]|uniref:Uncharacterized protein n=1 Tax=Rhododendron simsii TaxID=118357 RepID=A0A834GBW5_RHOSS|nr:hypothetical protein RHSIM_Rhsim10G0126400 [Rhododendron simsii]